MKNWSESPLMELAEHLEGHHLVLREKMLEVSQLMERVIARYGDKYGNTLESLRDFFAKFKSEMEDHFDKEEHVLIPYICQMCFFGRTGGDKPYFHYGGIKNPISLIEYEHDKVESVSLGNMRTIAGNYELPPDADDDFKQLYDSLQYIEKELREHIYLENEILFPRAMEMELRLMHNGQVLKKNNN